MNSITGVINSTQQAVSSCVANPGVAAVILGISTSVVGYRTLVFGMTKMVEYRFSFLERKVFVQIPMALFVGGVNFAVSKLLNLPFPLRISIPLTMAIYFMCTNLLEGDILDGVRAGLLRVVDYLNHQIEKK